VEVGTTNRTHEADYVRAVGPATAMLLKVHPSNYRVSGFVAEVPVERLARLAGEHGVPLLVDQGSGLLAPRAEPQLEGEPSFRTLLAAGADLVAGSGDKLLGGPQAGLLAGRAALVERCLAHPLYRALRLDRLRAAALDGVLRLHLAARPLPLDRLWPDRAAHRERLERLASRLGAAGVTATVVAADALVGGGAAPQAPIPGEALALPASEPLLARLRRGTPPVVGYLAAGRLVLDLRTVDPDDDEALGAAVARGARLEAGAER
jgi:L-seryl-tRNA(Ser) seleniumtransferase